MTTGQLIKAARKNAGMTQAELAQKLGISYVGISQWENDLRKPKYETICRIAAALDVDFADLVPPEVGGKMIVDHVLGRLKNLQSPLERTIHDMKQMTEDGQNKVADYAADILPRYRLQALAKPSPAAPTGQDGTEHPTPAQDTLTPEPPPESPENGEQAR